MAELNPILAAAAGPVGAEVINVFLDRAEKGEIIDAMIDCFPGQLQPGKPGPSVVGAALRFEAAPNWCTANAPNQAAAALGDQKVQFPGWQWRTMFGFFPNPPAQTTVPDWGCALFGAKPGKWGQFVLNCVYIPLAIMDAIDNWLTGGTCRAAGFGIISFKLKVSSFIEHWTGLELWPQMFNETATRNFLCPNVIPQPDTIVAGYLHGLFSVTDTIGWCKASGWCQYYTELVIDSQQYRHAPHTLVDMYRRGCIVSEPMVRERLRNVGVLDPQTQGELINCTYTLWDVGTIYRALRQLREGRVDKKLVYRETDARRDLAALGYAPERIDQMIYLAKHDVGHRQLLGPFKQGTLSESSLTSYLKDEGYVDEDIQRLLPYYNAERLAELNREVGAPSPAQLVAQAAAGEVAPDVWLSQMRGHGLTDFEVQIAVDEVNARRQRDIRAAGIAAVKNGLKAGELDAASAVQTLAGYNVPADAASQIVQVWLVEASAAHKPASIAQLCEWATRGWISVREYRQRLRALGWSVVDIDRIINACQLKARERQEKIDAANARRRVQEETKAANLAASIKKAQEASAAKLEAKKQKALDKQLGQVGRQLAEAGQQIAHAQTRAKGKKNTIDPAQVEANPPPPPGVPPL